LPKRWTGYCPSRESAGRTNSKNTRQPDDSEHCSKRLQIILSKKELAALDDWNALTWASQRRRGP
jgi:hypothetical protein